MKTSGFSFPISKGCILSTLIVLLPALSLAQCETESCLGLHREELGRKLAAGDYDFIGRLNASSPPGAEILSYAPGAGYFFALAAREKGRLDLFARFLDIERQNGTAPFRHWAVKELVEYLVDTGQYEKAESIAAEYLAADPNSPFRDRILFSAIESFYWRKNDREVLDRIQKYFPGGPAVLRSIDPELALFNAVSSCRLSLPGWETLVSDFFYRVKSSPYHARLFSFLEQNDEKWSAFSPFERDLFKAVAAAGDGRHREAAALFERLLPQMKSAALSGTALAADFTAAALGGAPSSRQAEILFSLAQSASGGEKAVLLESAGRLFLAARNDGRARTCFEAVLAHTREPELTKRAVSRLIRIGLNQGAEAGLTAFLTWGPRIVDAEYYTDAHGELLNLLMREGKYKKLLALAASPPAWLSSAKKASLAYIGARLLMENMVPPDDKTAVTPDVLLRAARSGGVRSYYGFLSAYFMNDRTSAEAFFLQKKEEGASPVPPPPSFNEAELLADGYLSFGLYRRAFAVLGDRTSGVSPAALAYWADRLARRGRPYEAIQTLSALMARSSSPLSRAQLEILYPRAFASLITPAAAAFGLDENLFFSLVRQESAFHSDITSAAGAIGLTQLMPETGAWIAAQLNVENPTLSDPATNIRFGAYYLSYLRGRLGAVPYTLAGYNAGPNAARRWQAKYGHLPADLAVEAFEYAETRDFVKSIFSGHVIYNLLYARAGIKESVTLFFGF